jgi:hypothetical protein
MIVNSKPVNYVILELTKDDIKDLIKGKDLYITGGCTDSYGKEVLVCCYCSDPDCIEE